MFVNGTPVIEIVLSNPLLSVTFPESGRVLAVIDTGYEGFAVVPREVFKKLRLDELSQYKRVLTLPTGKLVESTGSYARIVIPEIEAFRDGFVETTQGVDEIVLGTEFLEGFKLVLDYCARSFEMSSCW
ncbi:conserved hypothetical protein [Ferroglobus placidus DSM 10642]|uniref:Clan AA aspartic protease, AF_0612 family n=1 Tax=Ferroglobus placidus (strain DSM 10642 / AEDII12DO) TaxID=589924 RepID=D3S238_FERPA|nr:clan AA aspartic protease [Ferroglobus placidus]ADC66529.1 conserved hypothetical protein [Ferroglobus placidus DSM 10642]